MNIDQFRNLLEAGQERSVFAYEEYFSTLMRNLDVQSLLAKELRKCLADYRSPPSVVNWTTLTLKAGTWFNVDLTVDLSKEFRSSLVTHVDTLICFLENVDFELYTLQNYSKENYMPDAHIKLERTGTFQKGEIFHLKSSEHVLNLKSDQPIVCVSLIPNFVDEHACTFDTASGKVTGHFNISPSTTVIELMAKFLGAYGGMESLDCLRSLLAHNSDAVKWQAAQALGQIDYDEGIQAFHTIAAGESPMLKKAALATLQQSMGAA